MRYLAATELLYVMYIGSVARNRMSKKLERLLSVMLLPIINKVAHRPWTPYIPLPIQLSRDDDPWYHRGIWSTVV